MTKLVWLQTIYADDKLIRPIVNTRVRAIQTSQLMGEIVGAGFVSHAPTIMFPRELRFEINDGNEISLVPGLERLRTEVLDSLAPDAVVVFDTHWFTTVEFVVTAHDRRKGLYTSEELPRGMSQVPYDLKGDPTLAKSIAQSVENAGVRCHASEDPCLPIHYSTVNVGHFLNRGESWLSIGVCQTAQDHNFLAVGRGVADAIKESDQRVVLLASGGLSHRFWPLDELTEHENSNPEHILTPEARAADEQRLDWWQAGDHKSVIENMDAYRSHGPEGKFGHYMMMIGALGGEACTAKGRLFSNYENATGTGQVHVWFDRPVSGWCST
ncbi:MAG: catechol 1,2-dioxygenase [Pseudomonadota bacterium]